MLYFKIFFAIQFILSQFSTFPSARIVSAERWKVADKEIILLGDLHIFSQNDSLVKKVIDRSLNVDGTSVLIEFNDEYLGKESRIEYQLTQVLVPEATSLLMNVYYGFKEEPANENRVCYPDPRNSVVQMVLDQAGSEVQLSHLPESKLPLSEYFRQARKILSAYHTRAQQLTYVNEHLQKFIDDLEKILSDIELEMSQKLEKSISNVVLRSGNGELLKLVQFTKDIADPAFMFDILKILEDSQNDKIIVFAGKSHINNISNFIKKLHPVSKKTFSIGVPIDSDYFDNIPDSVKAIDLAGILGIPL